MSVSAFSGLAPATYRTIVLDPPWRFSGGTKGRPQHYARMSDEDIAALPVRALAHPEGCNVFVWVTSPKLPHALAVAKAWGARYSGRGFVWIKTTSATAGRRTYDMAEPLTTVHAGGNNQALVAPFVAYAQQGGAVRDVDGPLHTVTASAKDCNTVVAPLITKFHAGSAGASIEDPLATVTSNGFVVRPGGAAPLGLVAPYLVPRYGEREGQEPRTRSVEAPVGTVTAGGGGKAAIVAAFLAQHNGDRAPKPGRTAEAPISTITAAGSNQAVVQASLLSHSYGSSTAAGAGDPAEPLKTVTAGGFHAAEVRAFLVKYYGEGSVDQAAGDPLHTVPTRDRFGLVTTTIDGQPYAVVDIGMRMLSPRELFRAQGFPDSYVIDRGIDADGAEVRLTKTAQVRMCGNSVCPPMAEALVRANYSADQVNKSKPARSTTLPLFDGVAA